jgi:hypothetical protein
MRVSGSGWLYAFFLHPVFIVWLQEDSVPHISPDKEAAFSQIDWEGTYEKDLVALAGDNPQTASRGQEPFDRTILCECKK